MLSKSQKKEISIYGEKYRLGFLNPKKINSFPANSYWLAPTEKQNYSYSLQSK